MGVCRRTPEELEASWIEAYELRCTGMSFPDIQATLAGPPHFCGSKTTAIRWVQNGLSVVAAKGDPLRKRRARREMAHDALDALRVEMAQDVAAGNVDRSKYYELQLKYILAAVTIAGAQAPREMPYVKRPDGSKVPGVDPGLIGDLLGISREQLDAAIDATLPDDERGSP